MRDVRWQTRVAWFAAASAAAAAVVLPWVVYNNTRFGSRVFIATNSGLTLSAANCPTTYSGELFGYRDYACAHGRGDISLAAWELTRAAFGYTRYRAPADVPIVLLAGVGVDALLRRMQTRTQPGLAGSAVGTTRAP